VYTLREYQKQSVEKAILFLKDKSKNYNSIIVLPTGSGKSLVIANIIKELNEKTIVFQPTKEILEQNYKKLVSYGYNAAIFSASMNRKEIDLITFATIGSAVNKLNYFSDFKYILIDECHYVNSKGGMYDTFISSLNAKVLGFTATPYRLITDNYGGAILKFLTRTRPRVFKDVLYFVQNKELFDQQYLAKLEYACINGFDQSRIKKNSTGADFNDKSLKRYFDIVDQKQRIISVAKDLMTKRRGILIFCKFIDEANYVMSQIPGAEIVTAKTSKRDREIIIANFRSGKTKVVCNVGVLGIGFDYPELDTIILGRPTMSLAVYYQQIGRGIRPHQDKEKALIVDLSGNFDKFGKIEDLQLHENNRKYFISNGTRQLTNVYYDDNKPVKEVSLPNANSDKDSYVMPFGKYKGSSISDVPVSYLKWMQENIQLFGTLEIKVNSILSAITE